MAASDVLPDFKANNHWICENFYKLKQQYNNEWIAVLNKTVVDKDPDLKKLVNRLKNEHLAVYKQIAVEFIAEEEP